MDPDARPEDSRPQAGSGARAWWDSISSGQDRDHDYDWQPADDTGDPGKPVLSGIPGRRGRLLSAAMGATGIVAGIAIFIAFSGHPKPGHSARTGGSGCHAKVRSRQSAASAVPGYYIAPAGPGKAGSRAAHEVGIYATASGCELATAVPGQHQTVVDVSAAADDRTFAIATRRPRPGGQPGTAFYLVRFDPAGRTAKLTPLAGPKLPAGAIFGAFALSPDGSKLAVALDPGGSAPVLSQEIKILTIATGKVRTWLSSRGTVTGPRTLSWAADSSTLAFSWLGRHRLHPALHPLRNSGLRLLSTRRPGDNIVDDSRLAVRFRNQHGLLTAYGYLSGRAVLTPDRKALITALTGLSGLKSGFGEFSVATGKLKHKIDWHLAAAGSATDPADVLWTDQTGSTLIVFSPPGHPGKLGVWQAGQFTPLRTPGSPPVSAAW